jgi:cytochrome oxidase Cu insertion factor (SCO1/SenC/PrrC family)
MNKWVALLCIYTLGTGFCCAQSPVKKYFFLTINISEVAPDSMVLQLFKKTLLSNGNSNWSQPKQVVVRKNTSNQFRFKEEINEPCYFSLGNSFQIIPSGKYLLPLLNMYLAEPGDNVAVNVKPDSSYQVDLRKNDSYFKYIYQYSNYVIHFTGKGSAKYNCRYKADRSTAIIRKEGSVVNKTGNLIRELYLDKCFDTSITILNKFKNQLSQVTYQILYADFVGKHKGDWYGLFPWDWTRPTNDTSFTSVARNSLNKRIASDRFIPLTEKTKTISAFYSAYIIQREVAKGWANRNGRQSNTYQYLLKNFNGELRDKLITAYLCDKYPYINNNDSILNNALKNIRTVFYFARLEELSNEQSKGRVAYNFSLPDTSDKIVKLEDLKGKAVIVDFWYTGCLGCAQIYETALKDVEEEYRNNHKVAFVSINVDMEKDKWKKSIYSNTYTSPFAINLYTNGKGGEDEVIKYYNVSSYPKPLLIDKHGKIFSSSASDLRNKEKLRQLIEDALKER